MCGQEALERLGPDERRVADGRPGPVQDRAAIRGRFAGHPRCRVEPPARRRSPRPRAGLTNGDVAALRSRGWASCPSPRGRIDHRENQRAAAEWMKHLGESAAHPFALPRGEDHRVGPVTHVPASIRACRSRARPRRPYDEGDALLDARHRRPDLRRRLRRRRTGDAPGPRSRRGAPQLAGRRSEARPPTIASTRSTCRDSDGHRSAVADPRSPRMSTC